MVKKIRQRGEKVAARTRKRKPRSESRTAARSGEVPGLLARLPTCLLDALLWFLDRFLLLLKALRKRWEAAAVSRRVVKVAVN